MNDQKIDVIEQKTICPACRRTMTKDERILYLCHEVGRLRAELEQEKNRLKSVPPLASWQGYPVPFTT